MIGVFLIHIGLVHVVSDLAKEKLSRLFLLVKWAFLLNCTFKISPYLCFPEKFELMINSFSTG